MLRKGERVGDWIVEAPLGEGGMGAVYRVHSALTRRVTAALKVMKPSGEPDARARFVREAEALSALRHPAIVRVMGFNEEPERGVLYLVMELAPGETLRARLQRGPMAMPEALATFVPLAQGLDHAHSLGIFHRDLKPANVILSQDGTPRLVDFGIAAALEAEPLTTTGQLGTLPYLPPEVFRGERAHPAAIDGYAFGLLLHEALTGERPFALDAGATPAAAAASIGVRKLQAPALELPASMPERLRELVRRATDPDPKARPSMREIRGELESLVERRAAAGDSARLVATAPAVAALDEATTRVPDPTPARPGGRSAPTGARVAGRRRSDRFRAVLLTAAAIAAGALAVALVLTTRRPGPEPNSVAAAPVSPRPAPARPVKARPRPSPAAPSPALLPADSAESPGAPASPAHPLVTPAPLPARDRPPIERVPPAARVPLLSSDDEADREQPADEPPAQVGGRWELQHQVGSTSSEPFGGMRLGYRLTLVQEGSHLHGQGEKISENGILLLPSQRTPIDVVGRVQGGYLVLHFTELGRDRPSRGTIRLRLAPGGSTMQGRFDSDAPGGSGSSSARRLP